MFIYVLTIFILAAFLGYFTVWSVSPSLHSPLMSVSNAISGIVILGGLQIAGNTDNFTALLLSLAAIFCAAVNLMGGFVVSERMLELFKKRDDDEH